MGVNAPDVIQLERRGDVFIMSAARFGEPFQATSVSHVKLGDEVHAPDGKRTAFVSNTKQWTGDSRRRIQLANGESAQ